MKNRLLKNEQAISFIWLIISELHFTRYSTMRAPSEMTTS